MDLRVRHDGLFYRMMRRPLFTTTDRDRAERSKLTYRDNEDGTYSTTPLGVLNGLIGLRFRVES